MVIRFKKVSPSNLLAYLSLGLYLFVSLVNTSFWIQYIPIFIRQMILISVVVLLLIRELVFGVHTYKSLLGILAILSITLAIFFATGAFSELLVAYLLIYFCRDMDFRSMIKFSLVVIITILGITILASQTGILLNYIAFDFGRTREYLGFRYALFPSTVFLNIIATVLFLKGNRIKFRDLFILFAISFWIFQKTDSRLAFFSGLLLMMVSIFLEKIPYFSSAFKHFSKLLIFTPIFLPIISYIYISSYNSFDNLQASLNRFSGNRLSLAHHSLSLYGYSLFPQKITWIGNGLNAEGMKVIGEYLYVDNIYIHILQRYGVIFLVVILLLNTLALKRLFKGQQLLLFFILIIYLLHGLIDDLTLHLHYNIFLLLLGMNFRENYRIDKDSLV